MSFNLNDVKSKSNGPKQDLIEVGTVPGRLVRVIDLGMQPQQPYEGKEKAPARIVDFTYELSDVFMKDKDGNEDETKPRWISENFPLNNPKADLAKSTKRANAIDPEHKYNYDIGQMAKDGAPCMITIVHKVSKGNTYANVGNVSTMRAKDAEKCPPLKNEPVVFTLDDPDVDVFNSFPDWLKDKVKGNLEFNGSKLQKLLGGTPANDGRTYTANDAADEASEEGTW